MSEKRFTIIGKEYLGYTQGYAYIIRDNSIVCEPHQWIQWSVWEDKEDVEDLCDLLNEQDEKIKKLNRGIHINDELDKEKMEALKDAETEIKLLNGYLVEKGLAEEYVKWKNE